MNMRPSLIGLENIDPFSSHKWVGVGRSGREPNLDYQAHRPTKLLAVVDRTDLTVRKCRKDRARTHTHVLKYVGACVYICTCVITRERELTRWWYVCVWEREYEKVSAYGLGLFSTCKHLYHSYLYSNVIYVYISKWERQRGTEDGRKNSRRNKEEEMETD